MKKLLGILVLGMLLCSPSHAKVGKGELKLSEEAVNTFIEYLYIKTPQAFIISPDGKYSYYTFCPHFGKNRNIGCKDGSRKMIKSCNKATGQKCAIFSRGRKIYWKNGINKKFSFGTPIEFDQNYCCNQKKVITDQLRKLGFVNTN